MRVLIRQARVIDPLSQFHDQVADLLVEDGKIHSIDSSLTVKADQVIEGDGLCVSQGWVDVLADYREPGYEHKETIESGMRAAAAGGFTDVLLAPNTNPVTSSKSTVNYILQRSKGQAVRVHPLGAITADAEGKTLAEMLDMHSHGAIAFTDGWTPVQHANLMLKAMEYAKAFDGVLLQIPLDLSLSKGGLMHEGPVSTKLGMPGIPLLAETIMIHRDIELLRYTGSKLHITGVSTAEGVEMIRQAKAEGLNISCSVTPYHLALNDEALNSYDSAYKVSPVLRSETDRQALIAGIKDGTIDGIATHHRPQEWDAKAKEFEYASDGMNVQENAFSIVWDAIGEEVGLMRLVEMLTEAPRRIFGLPSAGIAKNNPAEMTIFTTAVTSVLNAEDLRSASGNNPFIGKPLKGAVTGIINQDQISINR